MHGPETLVYRLSGKKSESGRIPLTIPSFHSDFARGGLQGLPRLCGSGTVFQAVIRKAPSPKYPGFGRCILVDGAASDCHELPAVSNPKNTNSLILPQATTMIPKVSVAAAHEEYEYPLARATFR